MRFFRFGFRIPNHVAEQFGEFGGVFGFFPCITLEGFGYFRIAFPVGLTAHGKVHAHFRTFTHEMCVQPFEYLRSDAFGYTEHMFVRKGKRSFRFDEFFELLFGLLALGAEFGCFIAFVYVSAYGTNPFLRHNS